MIIVYRFIFINKGRLVKGLGYKNSGELQVSKTVQSGNTGVFAGG